MLGYCSERERKVNETNRRTEYASIVGILKANIVEPCIVHHRVGLDLHTKKKKNSVLVLGHCSERERKVNETNRRTKCASIVGILKANIVEPCIVHRWVGLDLHTKKKNSVLVLGYCSERERKVNETNRRTEYASIVGILKANVVEPGVVHHRVGFDL